MRSPVCGRGPMPRRLAALLRRWWVIPALIGMAAATVSAVFTPALSFDQGPGRVEVAVRPGLGGTSFDVPPFGTVSAPTHLGPATVRIRLARIDLDEAASMSAERRAELIDGLASSLGRAAASYVAVSAFAAVVLAALVASATPRRSWRRAAGASVTAAVSVLATAVWTIAGFDPDAFGRPRYTGALVEAPETWRQLDSAVDSVASVRGRLDAVASQIETLWDVAPQDAGTVDILHVSDIHLNPVGVAWTEELASRFAVDAVVDTGDITSFGLGFEPGVLDDVYAGLGVPYLVAFGNHDSPANRSALGKLFEPIHARVVDIGGVRILGFDDPTFTASGPADPELWDSQRADGASRLAELCRRYRPDVIAVHNPVFAAAASGCAPLVIAGHTHVPALYRLGSGPAQLRVAVTGSTGAGGIGQLIDRPLYEASLLHFDAAGRLLSVDKILLEPSSGEFSITRVPAGRFDDPLPDLERFNPAG